MRDAEPEVITSLRALRTALGERVETIVVGQQSTLDRVVAALGVGGHVLLEGVPGVAKTLLAQTVANALGLDFARVQFTPDMLPADLTGTMVLRGGELSFRPGPIFTNVLLADEINRTPPKTQAALLEAMQESQVSIDGESRRLPSPFLVMATQNPIEYEGTYPLPEAQLDRFFVRLRMEYPSEADERQILRLPRHGVSSPVLLEGGAGTLKTDMAAVREEVESTIVSEEVLEYIVRLVRATRSLPSITIGASPRAATHLLSAAKAAARLSGRDFLTPDDVVEMAIPVLAHRLVLSVGAELEGASQEAAVSSVLATIPVPR